MGLLDMVIGQVLARRGGMGGALGGALRRGGAGRGGMSPLMMALLALLATKAMSRNAGSGQGGIGDILGNIFGGGSSHVETPKLVGLYRAGLLNIDDMVTRTYRLEDINQGYQDMLDGNNIRGVITFDEADW